MTVDGRYCTEDIVPQYPQSSTDHCSITVDSIIGNHSEDIVSNRKASEADIAASTCIAQKNLDCYLYQGYSHCKVLR